MFVHNVIKTHDNYYDLIIHNAELYKTLRRKETNSWFMNSYIGKSEKLITRKSQTPRTS